MSLAILAVICLVLSITSGELLGQMNDKAIIISDGSNKDVPTRKLLYVVGVYPEWEKHIKNFKKEWGEQGEKYLAQENVYIHGDEEKSKNPDNTRRIDDAKIIEEPTLLQFDVPVIPNSKKNNLTLEEYNKDLIETPKNNINNYKRINPNKIKSELPGIIQMNAIETRRNDVAARRQQEYANIVHNILKSETIKPNLKLNEINDDVMLNNKYNNVDKMKEKNSSNLEKGEAESKDDLAQRNNNKIHKLYHNNWVTKSNSLGKENINNNEDNRKYRNINRMYGRIAGRNFGKDDILDMTEMTDVTDLSDIIDVADTSDMSDTLQNHPANTNEIAPNYSLTNEENDDLIEDNDIDDGKYTHIGKVNIKKHTPPALHFKTRNIVREMKQNLSPELELKWLKEVLIPRILNNRKARRFAKTESDEIKTNPNVGDDGSIEYLDKTNPTLNRGRETNGNKNDNISDAELREKLNLYSKLLLENQEKLPKQKLLNRKQEIKKEMPNTNLDDSKENTNRSV